MKSQFKNPLEGISQSAPQNDAWLTDGAPLPPDAPTPKRVAPTGQLRPSFSIGSTLPANESQRLVPRTTGNLVEQPTIKQPSLSLSMHSASTPSQMPGGYVQGQHGRYGSGQLAPSSMGASAVPPSMNGPQMFAPPQSPSGMGSALAAPNINTLNQANVGSPFSRPGATMLAASAAPALAPASVPGTFSPNRFPVGPGPSIGNRPPGRKADGPPGKAPGGKWKKKRRIPIWARIVIGVLSFLLILGGSAFAYYQVNFAGTVSNIVGQTVARSKGDGADPNTKLTNGILTGPRVNILLLGSDTDQKFQGTYIAQTDIIVTIDPTTRTVGMLSIPRDFYINVPGYGLHKLDEAYGLGGVALSRSTIEQDFGISINYYAWVGLDGFIKVIDTVNGVDVDVLHPIVDGDYPDDTGANANDPYAFKRLYLSPGPQHLDGPTALEYVRSRHADLVGDFGRSARQQQVLSALKTKLIDPSIFGQLTQIAQDLNGYVKTDMQLPDILKLMNFARSINANQINKLTLGPPYSHSGTSASGADVVIPDCTKIVPAISQFLQLGNQAACNIGYTGNPPAVATITPTSTNQPAPLSTPINANNVQNLGDMASNATVSLTSGPSDLFGVRSLLDLLLLGVFESPDAFQL